MINHCRITHVTINSLLKIFWIIFPAILCLNSSSAQPLNLKKANQELIEKGEVYFCFTPPDKNTANRLSSFISFDHRDGDVFYAYANQEEFSHFLAMGYDYKVLNHPGEVPNVIMADEIRQAREWNSYPTYETYLSLMNQFGTGYPEICQIINIGGTVNGRQILFAKVTDSVTIPKCKPRVMITSSMHGDELTGYILMLRLIDSLCTAFQVNPEITDLLDQVEIWINPLANPDGAYWRGNNTVNGSIRYNANHKDLNRNFPDPAEGAYPNGSWQPETIAMMNLMNQYPFTLSMNLHCGAEVLNFPWDTWSALHPDNDWFIATARNFVDTIHTINPNYMNDLLGYPYLPGIVNGYAWYRVVGGRQDYMIFFTGGREFTYEISYDGIPSGNDLLMYWNDNAPSFFNFIRSSLNGIRGIITDSITNLPVKAKIRVSEKELADCTWVTSDSLTGNYHRLISTGTYQLIVSAENYQTKSIPNVHARIDSTTYLNIALVPNQTSISHSVSLSDREYIRIYPNYPNPFHSSTHIPFYISSPSTVQLTVYTMMGEKAFSQIKHVLVPGLDQFEFQAKNLPNGIYFYHVSSGHTSETHPMLLLK